MVMSKNKHFSTCCLMTEVQGLVFAVRSIGPLPSKWSEYMFWSWVCTAWNPKCEIFLLNWWIKIHEFWQLGLKMTPPRTYNPDLSIPICRQNMHWSRLWQKMVTSGSITSIQSELDKDDDSLGLQHLAKGVNPQVEWVVIATCSDPLIFNHPSIFKQHNHHLWPQRP
jgi:hypothetical protein